MSKDPQPEPQDPPANQAGAPERLETLFEFPCQFPIKAIGRDQGDFKALVIELIGRHVDGLDDADITTRPGNKGNYLAVTVTIEATSKAQLDAIYQDLSDHDEVIMAL